VNAADWSVATSVYYNEVAAGTVFSLRCSISAGYAYGSKNGQLTFSDSEGHLLSQESQALDEYGPLSYSVTDFSYLTGGVYVKVAIDTNDNGSFDDAGVDRVASDTCVLITDSFTGSGYCSFDSGDFSSVK